MHKNFPTVLHKKHYEKSIQFTMENGSNLHYTFDVCMQMFITTTPLIIDVILVGITFNSLSCKLRLFYFQISCIWKTDPISKYIIILNDQQSLGNDNDDKKMYLAVSSDIVNKYANFYRQNYYQLLCKLCLFH